MHTGWDHSPSESSWAGAGEGRDAVTKYIDKILQIPASVPPTKIEADTAQAEAALARTKAAIDAIQSKTVTITTVNTGDGSNAPGPAYFASGGFASRYARGTDTIPTMLSPGEFTVRAAAARQMPAGALDYINRTGQLPPTQGGPQVVQPVVHVYVGGEAIDPRMVRVARQEITAAVRGAAATRPGL